jgi:DNA-binding SARP family transcriptional activator
VVLDVHGLAICVLGPVEVVAGEVVLLPSKQRRLLGALLTRAGQAYPVDALLEAVWGDAPPRSAMSLLQVYVSQLRKALPAPRGRRGERRGESAPWGLAPSPRPRPLARGRLW